MKYLYTILFLSFIFTEAVGQDKVLSFESDTTFWFSEYQDIRTRIGLKPTENIESDYYFRFWDGKKVIELRKEDKLIGTVTFLVQQYKRNKEGRIYFKKYQLTDSTTQAIQKLVISQKIQGLPTDNQIDGWNGGFDGITYIIEHSDSNTYSFKNYWTPTYYQDKIPEAKLLTDFIDKLNQLEELTYIGKRFRRRQPFSRWYSFIGSATIVTKVY